MQYGSHQQGFNQQGYQQQGFQQQQRQYNQNSMVPETSVYRIIEQLKTRVNK